jgi:hypothetical protein
VPHARRYCGRVPGRGQVTRARVYCALDGRRLEVNAAARVAVRTGVREARMHRENWRAEFDPPGALVTVLLTGPVDPQPAIAAPPSTAIAIQSELTRDLRIVLMAPPCTPAAVTGA